MKTLRAPLRSLLRSLLPAFLVTCGGLGLVLLGPTAAYACSCAAQSPEEYVAGTDVIVAGTVTSVGRGTFGSAEDTTYAVEVERVYRGEVGPRLEFRSEASGAACGLEGIEEGTRHVLFLQEAGEGLRASLCGGTDQVSEEQLTAIVGEPGPPEEEFDLYAPGGGSGWAVLGAAAAAGVLTVALLVWGSRRRVSD